VFEFIGEEDTFNRGRKIFVGAEDDAGTKKMMQIKQMVVRSIIKGKKAKDQQGDSTDEERDKSPKSQVRGSFLSMQYSRGVFFLEFSHRDGSPRLSREKNSPSNSALPRQSAPSRPLEATRSCPY